MGEKVRSTEYAHRHKMESLVKPMHGTTSHREWGHWREGEGLAGLLSGGAEWRC